MTIVIPFAKSLLSLKDAALKVLGRRERMFLGFLPQMMQRFFNFMFSSVFHLVFTSGNWWSTFEPPVFQWLVEVYKEVVVYLLQMHKVGIPSVEQRIFTCFLDTSLRFLEILHTVRNVEKKT